MLNRRYFFIHGGCSIVMLVFREVLYVLFSSQLLKLKDLSFPAEIVHREKTKKLVVLLGSGLPIPRKSCFKFLCALWLIIQAPSEETPSEYLHSTTIIANITNILFVIRGKNKKKDISSTSKLTSLKELKKKRSEDFSAVFLKNVFFFGFRSRLQRLWEKKSCKHLHLRFQTRGIRDTVDGNQKSRKTHHFRWWNLVVYLIIKWNDTVDGNQKSRWSLTSWGKGSWTSHPIIYDGLTGQHHPNGGWPWDFWLPSTVLFCFLPKKWWQLWRLEGKISLFFFLGHNCSRGDDYETSPNNAVLWGKSLTITIQMCIVCFHKKRTTCF